MPTVLDMTRQDTALCVAHSYGSRLSISSQCAVNQVNTTPSPLCADAQPRSSIHGVQAQGAQPPILDNPKKQTLVIVQSVDQFAAGDNARTINWLNRSSTNPCRLSRATERLLVEDEAQFPNCPSFQGSSGANSDGLTTSAWSARSSVHISQMMRVRAVSVC